MMKSKWSLIAVPLLALGLAGCGQEEAPAPSPDAGQAVTPPGAASDASGNQADQNTSNALPTQEQLDPIPEENKPGGRIEAQQGSQQGK